MNYEQRLVAAAKLVLSGDVRVGDFPVDCSELGVTATLKPHQVQGVSWLIRRYHVGVNVVLDGPGENFASYLFLELFEVVLCPLSVTDGWASEFAQFAPNLRVLRYVGEKEHRRNLRKAIYEHTKEQSSSVDVLLLPIDVLLTTYEVALIDQDFLSQIPWHYAIIDEAQRLKNSSSVLYNVLQEQFVMPRRLLMTGTPIQNNLTELWALMHFCMPSVFGTLEQFIFTFKAAADATSEFELVTDHDSTKVKEQFNTLKYVLGAFMLRRTKSKLIECGILMLPPLTEITVMVPLVALQKNVYLSILRKELSQLLAVASGASNNPSLQNMVVQLRKACSHPYLFPGIEPEPYEEGEHLIQASGKLIVLDQLLQKLRNSGHRVLLFAQMTNTLDILQDFMEFRKYSYERLDGSIRAEERFAAIRSFSQQLGKDGTHSSMDHDGAFVFMISTRAGGVGLNLVAADTVIFYEQDWNPQVDKQALQRAHRIGQIKHVLSMNLVTEHTVEEVIMRRAEKKLLLSHNVVGEDEMDQNVNDMAGAGNSDLKSIIFGLRAFDPTDSNAEKPSELNLSELNAMAEKLIALRHEQQPREEGRKFEINSIDFSGDGLVAAKGAASVDFKHGFDEASYLSWIENFEALKPSDDMVCQLAPKKILRQEKHLKLQATRKEAEEKKLAKWEALGYHSFSVKDCRCTVDHDIMSDSGSVNFVYGDCTHPSKVSPSEPTVIFSCVDDSGSWGFGGMFDALAKLSSCIPDAYRKASEFDDLHIGDLHLMEVTEDSNRKGTVCSNPQWVALAVVQSYNPRRKVPRSKISISHLESCLSKASFTAGQNSASIHMPRIGYQDGSDRSEWYTIERLLRKYASMYGIKFFVYYYSRSS